MTASATLPAVRSPGLPLGQCAQHRFARQANQHRHPVAHQLTQATQQRQIVLPRLAEAESGVDRQARVANAGRAAGGRARGQELAHLPQHVSVLRVELHGARLALHVHQANGTAAGGRGLQRAG